MHEASLQIEIARMKFFTLGCSRLCKSPEVPTVFNVSLDFSPAMYVNYVALSSLERNIRRICAEQNNGFRRGRNEVP